MAATVHPLDDAQLDAQVDAILDDPDTAAESGLFEIRNGDRANWAIWKVARLQAQLEEAEQVYRSVKAQNDAFIENERLRAEKAIEFLTRLTAGYHAIVLEQDPKRKTIRLMAGDLVARKQPDRWEIDDEVLLAWAEENCPDVVRQRDPEVDRNAVKRALLPAAGSNRVIEPRSGELVPGVTVVEGETKFSVKPRVVDQ